MKRAAPSRRKRAPRAWSHISKIFTLKRKHLLAFFSDLLSSTEIMVDRARMHYARLLRSTRRSRPRTLLGRVKKSSVLFADSVVDFFYKSIKPLPRFAKAALVGTLIFSLVTVGILINPKTGYAATYTFNQTDWQGGTDSGTLAAHATDQTGWTKYASISNASGTASAGNTVLTSTGFTATDSGTLASTGAATGGGFSSGTTSSTTVSGSGSTANIALSGTTFGSPWSTLAPVTGTVAANGVFMVRGGTEDDIYVLRGNGTNAFYKYSINNNTWSTLAVVPGSVSNGGYMIRNGTDNNIYVTQGGGATGFYKYSIASVNGDTANTWTTLAVVPGAVNNGGAMLRNGSANNIYVTQGATATGFYKYSIATTGGDTANTWTTLAVVPGATGNGSAMAWNGTDNNIYLLRGGGNTSFYRYSIATTGGDTANTWTTLTVVPTTASNGSFMIRNASDNNIYVLTGGTGFYRYSIATTGGDTANTWTALTIAPGSMSDGSTMLRNGSSDSVYIMQGNSGGSSKNLYKYSIVGNTWTLLPLAPSVLSVGGFMIQNTAENTIYVLAGNTSTSFYSYSLAVTPWTTLTAATAGAGDGTFLLRNGSDDIMYMVQGGGTGFYQYTFSTNAWTTLAVVPGAVGTGGYMIRNGSDNNIYLLRGGGNTSFYKYSIASVNGDTANTWTTLAVVPAAVGVSARMVRNASDNNIYVARGNNSNGFYRYSIATTGGDTANTWTTLAVVPASVGANGAMIRNGSDNNIYLMSSGFGTGFYRYSIATTGGDTANTWTTLTVVPAIASTGSTMIRNGSDNNIYVLTGGSGTGFYRYSIATTGGDTANTWTTLTATPGTIGAGAFMTRNSSDNDIYVLRGGSATSFYKYSITGNTWIELMVVPGTVSTGSFMTRNSSDNDIYILPGNGATTFIRYAITGNYAASGTFTSATIDTHGVNSYGNISWTNSTLPTTATLTMATRTSADGDSWSAWSDELSTASGSAIASTVNRYIQYRGTYATTDVNESPVLSSPIINYTAYNTSGNLVSSIFNSADAANIIGGLVWTEDASLPSGTTVTLSLRAAASSGGVAGASYSDFTNATTNCSKSTSTVTCTSAAIPAGLTSNAQYFQYKITLTSTNGAATPTVGSVVTTYVVNAAPQLQNVSATQNSDGTVTIGYDTRDPDTATGSPANQGHVTPSFEYWNGSTLEYVAITTLAAGDTNNKSVNTDGTTWSSYTATWTPTTDFNNQFMDNTAKIRITVNDNEGANNTTQSETATYTLDTKVPASASVVADYSTANSGNSYLATLTLAATDNSSMTMVISTHSNYSSPLFSGAYASSKTVSVGNTPDSPDTIYVRFTDAKGNSTSVSATPSARATNMMIQDISNIAATPAEYRLFTAWKAVSPTGFGSYKVYRSTDQSSWSLLSTIASASTNYYTDSTPSANTAYYYRVTILNSTSDISFVSATVSGTANGTQDPGEGTGGTEVAPVISSVASSSITPTTATITWNTDQISNSTVGYSTTSSLFNITTSVSSMVDQTSGVGEHIVVLSGLLPGTPYYFNVSSTNATGATGSANSGGGGYTFTTLTGPAITATGTARTETITNTTATIVWQTSSVADSEVISSMSPTFSSSSTSSLATMVTDHSVTLTSLSAATQYFFYVQSTDADNHVEQDKNVVDGVARYYSFTTSNDSTAPTISAVSAVAQTTTAVILWTTNEPATSQIEYGTTLSYGTSSTLDSTLTTQHSVSLSGLSSGASYNYRIKTRDTNTNLTTSANYTFSTGDATAPTISSVTSSSLALTGATVTWTTNEQANSIVEYGTSTSYGSTAGSEVEAVTSHSVTLSGLSANTLYYYRVRSRDAAGNLATSDNTGAGYTFTTVADSAGPTISNVTAALVSDTSAIITWVTNEVANARVDYGITTAYGTTTATSSSYTTTQTVTITGLTKSTHYYFKVTSIDPSTNSTTNDNASAGYEFTTTADPLVSGGGGGGGFFAGDVTPPNILDLKVTNITSSSARIEWLTDEAANTMVSYNAPNQPAFLEGNSDESAPSHVVTLTGLDPATTYSFRPVSYDAKGNKGTGELSKFTTLSKDGKIVAAPELGTLPAPASSAPTTPAPAITSSSLLDALKTIISNPLLSALPESTLVSLLNELSEKAISPPSIISNKASVEVKGTTAIITWSTDKKTIGVVAYGKDGEPLTEKNQFSIAGNINTYNTDHKVTLDKLDPATIYRYEVQAKAAYGPEAKFVAGTFTTTTELPVIANIKLSSISDNSVTVQWKTNTPTSASVEYTNRDTQGTLAKGDTSLLRDHSITIKDLISGAPYSLIIKAADEFKNESISGGVPFTTGKDILAPDISKVTAESTIYPGKESRVQTIVTWTTDEPATSQVFYQEGVGTEAKAIELSKDSTLSPSHTTVVTRFAPASIYKFWVVSVDASGNSARSKDYTILTPQQKETVVDVILKNFEQTFGWTSKLRSP